MEGLIQNQISDTAKKHLLLIYPDLKKNQTIFTEFIASFEPARSTQMDISSYFLSTAVC